MADLEDLDLIAPADSLYSGGVKINLMRARLDGLYTVLSDITTAEANQVENIATTTISAAQWGYLGACGAGGGQLLAALTAGESTQLEAIGDATISSAQWGYLGACTAGGGQLLAALTASESTQLEAIGATTISLAQWGYLGACGAGGGQLLAALTTGESTQLEAIGSVTITNTQWGYLGALNQGLTTTSTVTFGTINAFTLGGKLTAGASEIEGTGFDINGGTIGGVTLDGAIAGGDQGITGVGDMTFTAGSILAAAVANTSTLLIKAGGLAGTSVITVTSLDAGDTLGLANVTSLVATGPLDIGAQGFRANTLTADGLTPGRLVRAGTAGLLGDATVTESSGALGGITTLSMTGNLTVGGTVDGVDVAALKTDVDGFPDDLKSLAATEIAELEAIGDTTISSTQWGYLGGASGIGHYVDRGDPSGWDYSSWTTNNAWHDLNLSNEVPAGAVAVHLRGYADNTVANQGFMLRENGNSNELNMVYILTQVANIPFLFDGIVRVDSDRVIEYKAVDSTWNGIYVLVRGWWIP